MSDYEKTPEMERAYDEGARARMEGKTLQDSPYDSATEARAALEVEWRQGWKDRAQHERRVRRPKGAEAA